MATVLIADDSLFSRQALKDIVAAAGFDVVRAAADGEEAVFLYELLRPDVVTMDLNMPKMGGLAAMSRILAFDPRAQIVVISALGSTKMVRQALLAGARDFLVKPLEPARVAEAVERAARSREQA